MRFYEVDEDYLRYLKKYDSFISNEKNGKKRRVIGVLVKIEDMLYIAPLSSPKEKHKFMKQQYDVFLIDKGDLGVVNFNNMIPVTHAYIKPVIFSEVEDVKYRLLLEKQYRFLKSKAEKIQHKAKRLYMLSFKQNKNEYEERVIKRCCVFSRLEQMMKYYRISLNKLSY